MMDDKIFAQTADMPESAPVTPDGAPADAAAPAVVVSECHVRFQSCRWRATPDQGPFCTHRDVLPFAGKEGFAPDSWCGDCAFYKLRRTPKKRDYSQY